MKQSKLFKTLSAAAAAFCVASGAFAVEPNETLGARAFSLGNAGVGEALNGSSPFFNPAGVAKLSENILSLHGGFPVQKSSENDQQTGAFSIIQTAKPGSLPWSLFGVSRSTEGVHRQTEIGLNLGKTFLEEGEKGLYAGVNLLYRNNETRGIQGGDETSFALDAGLIHQFSKRLSFGAAGYNLTKPKDQFGSDARSLASGAAGLSYLPWNNAVFLLDVHVKEGQEAWDVRPALEQGLFDQRAFLRLGSNKDFFTTGIGFKAGALSLDYGYSYPFILSRDNRQHTASIQWAWGGERVLVPAEDESEDEEGAEEASNRIEKTESAEEEKPVISESEKRRIQKALERYGRRSDLPIGPEDTIYVLVKEHPELTAEKKVDAWGFVELPFIEELKVDGLTPAELSARLEDIYRGFVKNPQVEVTVKEFMSRNVLVLGAVEKPGKVAIGEKRMTLRDAIVEAGLPTPRAAEWRTFVVRQTEEGPIYYRIHLGRILYRGNLTNDMVLQRGDVVYVPMTILDSIATFIGRLISPLVGTVTGLFGAAN